MLHFPHASSAATARLSGALGRLSPTGLLSFAKTSAQRLLRSGRTSTGEAVLDPAADPVHQLLPVVRFRVPLYHKDFPLLLLWSEKSGCTSLVKWFFYQIGELEHAKNYHPGGWVHDYENNVYKRRPGYLKQLTHALCTKDRDVCKVIRNPYHRAVSSFLILSGKSVLASPRHPARSEWRTLRQFFYHDEASDQGISFKQFLYYLKAMEPKVGTVNPHFAEQYVEGEERYVGKYLRLDNFDRSMRALESQYGLRNSPLSELTRSPHHRSEHMTASGEFAEATVKEGTFLKVTPTYESFYDSEATELVEELFQKDFRLYARAE